MSTQKRISIFNWLRAFVIVIMKRLASPIVGGLSVSLFVALCITQIPSVLASSDSWPMFQHDRQHTGHSLQIGPQTTSLRWSFPTSGVPGSVAIGGDGTIYLPVGMLNADTSGYLYAINSDGTQKWKLSLDILPSSTAPALGPDGTIYVHGNGNQGNLVAIEKLYAINPNGTTSWTFLFNGGNGIFTSYVQSSPVVGADGTIYIGSMDTNLYALNSNGTIKWAHSPSISSIDSSPALAPDGNTVYIVDGSTTLYAYSSSGTFQWEYQLSDTAIGTGNPQSASIGTDGTIYIGSPDKYLYAINPNGTLKWRFLTDSRINATPALATDGTIYVGSNGLYALNPNGTQKWKFSSALFSSVSPIIDGNGLIYWRENFMAYAVNPNGTQKWSLSVNPFTNGLESTAAIGSDGILYLPTSSFFDSGQNGLDAYASPLFNISGNVGVAGVTMSYVDETPKTVQSDSSGNYSITVLSGWSGTITPSKAGYSFSPVSRSYSNVVADQTGQNYCAGCADTTGVFRPSNGLLYLKNLNITGFADVAINYGTAGDYPVTGDWDGNGTATIGIYRNGSFYLRNSNTLGFADLVFAFGQPGDQPVAGDWNGDGVDTIGVFRTSTGQFLLRDSNSAGAADYSFYLGNVGDVGIAGDWTAKGFDTVGVFRPSNGIIFLKNTNQTGFADIALNYGLAGDQPVVGDWDGNGTDTIGVYRNAQFLLRNSNTIGFAEIVFGLGIPGDIPIAGDWDALP